MIVAPLVSTPKRAFVAAQRLLKGELMPKRAFVAAQWLSKRELTLKIFCCIPIPIRTVQITATRVVQYPLEDANMSERLKSGVKLTLEANGVTVFFFFLEKDEAFCESFCR